MISRKQSKMISKTEIDLLLLFFEYSGSLKMLDNDLHKLIKSIMIKLLNANPRENIDFDTLYDSKFLDPNSFLAEEIEEYIKDAKNEYNEKYLESDKELENTDLIQKQNCEMYLKFLEFFLLNYEDPCFFYDYEFRNGLQIIYETFIKKRNKILKDYKDALSKENTKNNRVSLYEINKCVDNLSFNNEEDQKAKGEQINNNNKKTNICSEFDKKGPSKELKSTGEYTIDSLDVIEMDGNKSLTEDRNESKFEFTSLSNEELRKYRMLLYSKIKNSKEESYVDLKDQILEIPYYKKFNKNDTKSILLFFCTNTPRDDEVLEDYFFFLGFKEEVVLNLQNLTYILSQNSEQCTNLILSSTKKLFKLFINTNLKMENFFDNFNEYICSDSFEFELCYSCDWENSYQNVCKKVFQKFIDRFFSKNKEKYASSLNYAFKRTKTVLRQNPCKSIRSYKLGDLSIQWDKIFLYTYDVEFEELK